MADNSMSVKAHNGPNRDYMPVAVAARSLGISRATLAKLIAKREVTTRKVHGSRRVWIFRSDVQRLADEAVMKSATAS
jgi:excisionase family DNA binding protein